MASAGSGTTYRRGLDVYLTFVAIVTLVFALITARVSRSWSISDWLINYQGGFVRRGLVGELVYQLSHLLKLSPVFLVVLLYLSLCAALLLAVRDLFLHSSWSLWVLALLVSPATLSFQILDPTAGFRKETIYLAALAVLVVWLRNAKPSPAWASVYIAVVLCAGTLSHELLICYAPYFFAALVVATGCSPMRAARQCAIPFLLGAGCAYLCTRHLGNVHTAQEICTSLGYRLLPQGSQICSGGAIEYLTHTREMAREETRAAMAHYGYFRLYLTLTVLALLPLLVGTVALTRSGSRRDLRVVWGTAAVSFLASLLLFVYAVDWGRWIYIHVFSLTILLLCVDGRSRQQVAGALPVEGAKVSRLSLTAGLLLAVYATLWTLPHVPMRTPRFGYIGLADYALHYRQRHAEP
jgi:hypothetical protein